MVDDDAGRGEAAAAPGPGVTPSGRRQWLPSGFGGLVALGAIALLAGFAGGRWLALGRSGSPGPGTIEELAGTLSAEGAATSAAQAASPPDTGGLSVGLVRPGAASVGEPVPDFTLSRPDGGDLRLADYAGKPFLINFFATWCIPCELEMPLLQAAYENHAADDLVVVGVDFEETAEVVAPWLEEKGITFPVGLDSDGALSRGPYRVSTLPTSVLVGADGDVAVIRRGAFAEKELEKALAFILP